MSPGDLVDRYRIVIAIGQGGMGRVYRAVDERLERQVALKVLHERGDTEEAKARLIREARAVAKLDHPNVVAVHDAGTHDGRPYVVMELVLGRSLRELIGDDSPGPDGRVRILLDVARGLAAAHDAGLVHRDVKPENVLVRDDGRVKVVDFGIARRTRSAVDPSAPTEAALPTLTAEGAKVGTPAYMAPEQIRGLEIDGRTDQFAWGVTAYELFAGKPPWGGDAMELIAAILTDDPPEPPPSAGMPPEILAIVKRALAKRREDRYPSMHELVRRLEEALPEPASASRPPSADPGTRPATPPVERKRRWPLVAGFAAALLAAVAGARVLRGRSIAASVEPAPAASASSLAAACAPFADCDPDGTRWRVPLRESPRRGAREPLVVIVVFADFECPFSAAFQETLRRALEAHPDEVAVVWKHVPYDAHPHAAAASRFAVLVRSELGDDAFWKAHDLLFQSCSHLHVARFGEIARELGLDPGKVQPALDGPEPAAITQDVADYLHFHPGGLPSYYVNGRRLVGAHDFEKLRPVLAEEIARARDHLARGVPRRAVLDAVLAGATPGPRPPKPRVAFEPRDPAPCLLGKDAGADPLVVHQFGDYASGLAQVIEPTRRRLVAEYGERIKLCWHPAPDPSKPDSVNAAVAARAAYDLFRNDGFWRLHPLLLEAGPQYFDPSARPAGFERAAIMDSARRADVAGSYFGDRIDSPATRERVLSDSAPFRAAFGDDPPIFLIDGIPNKGVLYAAVRRDLERAFAERGR